MHGEQREIPNFKQALCSGRIAVPVENTVTGDLTVIQVSQPWQIRYKITCASHQVRSVKPEHPFPRGKLSFKAYFGSSSAH